MYHLTVVLNPVPVFLQYIMYFFLAVILSVIHISTFFGLPPKVTFSN